MKVSHTLPTSPRHSVVYDHISAHFFPCGYVPNLSVGYPYNKINDLPYSDLGRIHKDTGNGPLQLGHFFNFREFSVFYSLKLLKSIPFDKR